MVRITRKAMIDGFRELSIELTQRCSLNCIYCSSNSGMDQRICLEITRIKKIIQECIDEYGINAISLSGGESFLYPNFDNLYDFLVSKDLDIIVYTSGIILEKGKRVPISNKILNKLHIHCERLKIIINIQGHTKDLIEKINGINGSYQLIEQSINRIVSKKIYLGANIVPFKYNSKYLLEIVNYCISRSFNEVNFLRFVPQGRGKKKELNNTLKEFRGINSLLNTIVKIHGSDHGKINIRIGHPINFLFLNRNSINYSKEKNHYCRGGIDAPVILPDGDVSMCPAWKDLKMFSAGNIYLQNFKEIWESNYFKIFRKFVKETYKQLEEPCRSCIYLNECRGKCVAQRLLSQNILNTKIPLESLICCAPDPQCFINDIRMEE